MNEVKSDEEPAAAEEARAATERQQVELVFGLTGGELNDEAWAPYYVTDTFGEARQFVSTYNYDDVPEWAEDSFPTWALVPHKTMVRDIMFGNPPKFVWDARGIWERIAIYASSGETDCFCTNDVANADKDCALCEGDGFVYVGDGWAEIVYKLIHSNDESED